MFVGHFCPSWILVRIQTANPDTDSGTLFNPDPIRIRIQTHNTASNAIDCRQDFQHGGAGRHPPSHSQQRQVLPRLLCSQQGGRGGTAAGGSSGRRWGGGRGTTRSLTTFRGCLRTGLSFQAELSWSFLDRNFGSVPYSQNPDPDSGVLLDPAPACCWIPYGSYPDPDPDQKLLWPNLSKIFNWKGFDIYTYTLRYVFFNSYKGRLESLNMPFLHFYFLGGQFWPAWIRIRIQLFRYEWGTLWVQINPDQQSWWFNS